MATETTKHHLKKPAQNEFYNVDEYGETLDIIDNFYSPTNKPTATDVGARPVTWMPTAADIGAFGRYGPISNVSANDLREQGSYTIYSAYANTITDIPFQVASTLHVFDGTGGSLYRNIQLWTRTSAGYSNSGDIYYRTGASDGQWNPWKMIASEENHNIKTFTSLEQLGLGDVDFSTSTANEFLQQVILSVVNKGYFGRVMLNMGTGYSYTTAITTRIASDTGERYWSGDVQQGTIIVDVGYNQHQPHIVTVLIDNGDGKSGYLTGTSPVRDLIYQCVCDTTGGLFGVSKFARTYHPDGFLPLSGGNITGNLTINSGAVFGEHNKPSGIYTGTGLSKNVDIGAFTSNTKNILITRSDNAYCGIVNENGCMYVYNNGYYLYSSSSVYFDTEAKQLKFSSSVLNVSGYEYRWTVL